MPQDPDASKSTRARAWYEDNPRSTKRTIVGGSSVGLNLVLAWLANDVFDVHIPDEVAMALGGMVAGAVAWLFSGAIFDMLIAFAKFRKALGDIRREK